MKDWIEKWIPSPFLRFVLCGGISALFNILARVGFSQIMIYEAAVVLAYLVGMTIAYLLMKLFVFQPSQRSVSAEYTRFGIINLISLLQVYAVSVGCVRWLFPALGFTWHAETVAHVIGVASPIVTSYVGHKYFTFDRKRPPEPREI